MVVSDILRAGIVLSFLFVDRLERAWLIYMLTVAQFIVASFFEPASSAILPGVVKGKEELVTANVLSSITWSTMLAVGAALGGVFAGMFGAQAALNIEEDKIPEASDQGGFRDLIDGFRYILHNIQVAVLTLVKSFGQIGSADIFIAVFAESYFPIGEGGAISMGILFGAAGLGALIGPLIGDWLMPRTGLTLRKAIQSGYLLIPFGWLLVSWSPTIWVAALGIMVRLIGTSINWTYSTVLIQMEVPDRYLGRVFSVDLGLFTLATSTAIYLTGYFLDNLSVGARQLGVYFAIGSLLPAVLWALYHARKKETT